MALKIVLGQMISLPINKPKKFIPQICILRLIVVIKSIVIIFRKEGFLLDLFLSNPCSLKDLEKGLLELSTR